MQAAKPWSRYDFTARIRGRRSFTARRSLLVQAKVCSILVIIADVLKYGAYLNGLVLFETITGMDVRTFGEQAARSWGSQDKLPSNYSALPRNLERGAMRIERTEPCDWPWHFWAKLDVGLQQDERPGNLSSPEPSKTTRLHNSASQIPPTVDAFAGGVAFWN